MERIPEPELMLDPAQARAYAEADFSQPHDHFVALLRERLPTLPETGRALDLGCGPGDIAFRFAHAFPGWQVDGVDGSPAMLSLGRARAEAEGLEERVQLHERRLPDEPLPRRDYGLAFSNSLLHHLADPGVLWRALQDGAAGGRAFVMDLLRPADVATAERLVREHAAGEPEVLRHDFYHSLLAAYRVGEVEAQLSAARLDTLQVETVSDRHWIAWGTVPT